MAAREDIGARPSWRSRGGAGDPTHSVFLGGSVRVGLGPRSRGCPTSAKGSVGGWARI